MIICSKTKESNCFECGITDIQLKDSLFGIQLKIHKKAIQ